MALNIKQLPTNGGGWIKPAEHLDDVAILVEVKSFDVQRPTPNGPKDSVLADVTYFADEASLAAGEPTEVAKGQRIEQTILARDLQSVVGGAVIVTLDQVQPKKAGQRPAWVWRAAPAPVQKQVVAYAEKREAEVEAALGEVPDFD